MALGGFGQGQQGAANVALQVEARTLAQRDLEHPLAAHHVERARLGLAVALTAAQSRSRGLYAATIAAQLAAECGKRLVASGAGGAG